MGSGKGCLTTSPINVSYACKNTCSNKVPPSEAERLAPALVPYLLSDTQGADNHTRAARDSVSAT